MFFRSELLNALDKEHNQYRAILFMTYLYYPTIRGIQKGYKNAILIPTVHDEPAVYLRVFDHVFSFAQSLVWNTQEERKFAQKRFPMIIGTPEVMAGIGIETPEKKLPDLPELIRGCRYLVYAGRIDKNKGCGEMFEFFRRYKKRHENDLKLVLMGKEAMQIPKDPDIIHIGFVSEETKYAVMADAVALILFSSFESLSMVVLESMAMRRPVLVTGRSEVLKGHCLRSGAGLYFYNYEEFETALDLLLTDFERYEIMRENGKRYIQENYRWDVIIKKYKEIIDKVVSEKNV